MHQLYKLPTPPRSMSRARITPLQAKMATFGNYPVVRRISNRQMSRRLNSFGSGVWDMRASDRLKTQDQSKECPFVSPQPALSAYLRGAGSDPSDCRSDESSGSSPRGHFVVPPQRRVEPGGLRPFL